MPIPREWPPGLASALPIAWGATASRQAELLLPLWLTQPVISEQVLVSSLWRYWHLSGGRVTVHNGGMGSQTWFVDLDDRRLVAKAVASRDGVQFAGGMVIARQLEQAGIPAGAPLPATTGQFVVNAGDDRLALLTWVPGHALTGHDSAEQGLIGTTLARVHRALAGYFPQLLSVVVPRHPDRGEAIARDIEIGRASCRERVSSPV